MITRKKQIEFLCEMNEALRETLIEKRKKNRELKTHADRLQALVDELEATNKTLWDAYNVMLQKRSETTKTLSREKEKLALANAKLCEHNEKLVKRNNELFNSRLDLGSDLARLKKELDRAESEICRLEKEKHTLEERAEFFRLAEEEHYHDKVTAKKKKAQ